MSARHAIAALSLALVALAAGVARADNAKAAAAAHLVRGSRLYDQGRYDDAVAELKTGYALDARPEFLYALGQAERKRGDCRAAIGWYQRYVDSGPSTQRTVATLLQIDRCKEELASSTTRPAPAPPPNAQPVEPPAAAPPPAETAPPPSAAPAEPAAAAAEAPAPARDTTPRASTPLYKKWWLWTLVAVVVAGGVGAGVAIALSQRSTFDSTLPDLSWGGSALGVRF